MSANWLLSKQEFHMALNDWIHIKRQKSIFSQPATWRVHDIMWSVYSDHRLPRPLTKPSAPIRPLPDTLKVTSASQFSNMTLFLVHMEPRWLLRDGVIRTWSALGIAPGMTEMRRTSEAPYNSWPLSNGMLLFITIIGIIYSLTALERLLWGRFRVLICSTLVLYLLIFFF